MEWGLYMSFLAVVLVIAITPGADTAVVLKNVVTGGRRGGVAAAGGVFAASAMQAVLVAIGLGILIAQSQTLLQVIRWVGAAYLLWLAFQSVRSAVGGEYGRVAQDAGAAARRGFLQGFLANATNPQVLLFYLALLPQFISPDTGIGMLLLWAMTLPVIGTALLLAAVLLMRKATGWLERRAVRRSLDAITGVILGGLGVRVAADAVREAA
ncbi:LysE family translocator [Nesterenkonia populi]|uniref:LysE family translocator n=1 Tax=Nesterenkonia populi TaxID=1591087 RepID=UPI0011BEE3B1|nr:LysE family translocator [Nesterenkonia populi]